MSPTGIVLTEEVKEISFMYLFLIGLGQLVLVGCMKILFLTFILSPVNIIRDLVVYKSSISNEQLQRGLLWVQYFAQ